MSDKIDELVVAQREEKSNLSRWYYAEKGKVKPEILERRRQVAILWNQMGYTVQRSAEELGFSNSTVLNDRRWLLDCWQKTVQADVVEIVAREMNKLEAQEAELWAAWEKSKEDVIQTTTEQHFDAKGQKVGGETKKIVTYGRLPEVKFMDGILKCQERRSKLLGLDKAVTFQGAAFSFAMFVEEAYESATQQLTKDVTPPKELPEVTE